MDFPVVYHVFPPTWNTCPAFAQSFSRGKVVHSPADQHISRESAKLIQTRPLSSQAIELIVFAGTSSSRSAVERTLSFKRATVPGPQTTQSAPELSEPRNRIGPENTPGLFVSA